MYLIEAYKQNLILLVTTIINNECGKQVKYYCIATW